MRYERDAKEFQLKERETMDKLELKKKEFELKAEQLKVRREEKEADRYIATVNKN
jgi:hypothetical protein